MNPKIKSAATHSVIAVACFSAGFIGATQITPALAQKPLAFSAGLVDPELRTAMRNHIQKRFFNLIDASDSQKKKLTQLFDGQMQYAQPIRAKMLAKGIAISDMIADQSVSDQELLDEINTVKAMRQKVADRRQATMIKVRSILTKEQKEIIALKMKAKLTGNPRLGLNLNR